MIYQAKVLHQNAHCEEEVVLQFGVIELTCFAFPTPLLTVGQTYPVELYMNLLGDNEIAELDDDMEPSFSRIGDGFGYVITGKLNGGCLECCGLVFGEEGDLKDLAYLDGKMISIRVDRIAVQGL